MSTSPKSSETFDGRLRAVTADLGGLVRPLLAWLLILSLIRFMTWVSADAFLDPVAPSELALAFFTGFRFDLLILGFVLIPVVLVGLVAGLTSSRVFAPVVKAWLASVWIALSVISAVSWLFFLQHGRQAARADWGGDWGVTWTMTEILGVLIFCALGIQGARLVIRAKPIPMKADTGWTVRLVRLLGPIVIVALMARGTLTAHHLEKRHSEISANKAVNQLALNGPWFLDKDPSEF